MPESRPYRREEIPQISIDYRGLVEYAKTVGKTVPELSDEEKNRFIGDGYTMEMIREDRKNWMQ